MSTGYSSRAWACPFLKWDEKQKIHCEGGCVSLQDPETYAEYTDRYCANVPGWESCTIASALTKYYERKPENEAEYRQNQEPGA